MKAKDLAAILLQNPEDEVCVPTSNFEQGNNLKAARGTYRFKGDLGKRHFRDAFDRENYTSEVVEPEGNTMFVQITS